MQKKERQIQKETELRLAAAESENNNKSTEQTTQLYESIGKVEESYELRNRVFLGSSKTIKWEDSMDRHVSTLFNWTLHVSFVRSTVGTVYMLYCAYY